MSGWPTVPSTRSPWCARGRRSHALEDAEESQGEGAALRAREEHPECEIELVDAMWESRYCEAVPHEHRVVVRAEVVGGGRWLYLPIK